MEDQKLNEITSRPPTIDEERVLEALDRIHYALAHLGANLAASVPFLLRRVDPEEFQDEDCFENCDSVGPFVPRLANALEEICSVLCRICANHAASMPEGGRVVEPAIFWDEEALDEAGKALFSQAVDLDKTEADRHARIAAGEQEPCRVCGGIDTNNCPGGLTWAESGLCASCAEKQEASGHEVAQ